MRTITIELPDYVGISETEAQRLLLLKIYQEGLVSAERAAEALGCSKWEFVQLLGAHRVSYILPNLTDQAIEEENWKQYANRHC